MARVEADAAHELAAPAAPRRVKEIRVLIALADGEEMSVTIAGEAIETWSLEQERLFRTPDLDEPTGERTLDLHIRHRQPPVVAYGRQT